MKKEQVPHPGKKIQILKNVFAILGIIALISTLFNLFIVVRPQKKDFVFSTPIVSSDTSFVKSLAQISDGPVVTGGNIEILNNGDAFYPSLYKDIGEAKDSIHFSAYIWKEGKVSNELSAVLMQKAQEGIKVRLLLDGFGAKSIPEKTLKGLEQAGVKVAWFHPVSIGSLTKIHKRNHARSIVIDEKISYTGGMAVADYWQGTAQDKNHWRDTMFRITGPSVSHLSKTFASLWEITSGEVLVPNTLLPNRTDSSALSSSSSLQTISITSLSPDQDIEKISTFFAASIASAKVSIDIVTPYMILEERVENELISAAERGVRVRILVPGEVIDSKIVQSASQIYYTRLLESGILIYEYNPTMIHSKYVVVDTTWSLIGSANLDTRSTFFNVENIMGVRDTTFAADLTKNFENDIQDSTSIVSASWKKRSPFRKVFEVFASLIDKQL